MDGGRRLACLTLAVEAQGPSIATVDGVPPRGGFAARAVGNAVIGRHPGFMAGQPTRPVAFARALHPALGGDQGGRWVLAERRVARIETTDAGAALDVDVPGDLAFKGGGGLMRAASAS